jgi:hypothetical protein
LVSLFSRGLFHQQQAIFFPIPDQLYPERRRAFGLAKQLRQGTRRWQ